MKRSILIFLIISMYCISCKLQDQPGSDLTVTEVMDDVITRIYSEISPENYETIDQEFMLGYLTEAEKHVLATRYQSFNVNVPVKVSIMRSVRQPEVPFWLEESGFVKTRMKVRNDVYEYEVWQKDFDKGLVSLGINGFDMHRTVYFVCVGPVNPNDSLQISSHYPSQYPIMEMKKGAFTYHDWSSLLIQEIPKALDGQALFTTVRGRAREAHVENAFRKTNFPSSDKPDQLMQTWSGDPTNSLSIQWRTNTSVPDGLVKYWQRNATDTLIVEAEKYVLEDRMLYNDRYIHRFTGKLTELEEGTEYEYVVGANSNKQFSKIQIFETQKRQQDAFSFIWFGDTHHSKIWGDLIQQAEDQHPEVAFYSVAGDLVSTGLYRNEWDDVFGYSGDVFSKKPFMPVPGNHDRQDGLGAWMYYRLFDLPKDAPASVHPESTYAFRYGNALFLMIDSTHPVEAQSSWIEEKLKHSDATWKFAMFHFPPYNFEEPYPDIQKAWCSIFDKYHVDMVMAGHVHYYMRSKPMFAGKAVDNFDKGTVYVTSIGINGNHNEIGQEPYAEVRYKDGQFYQYIAIEGVSLFYKAFRPSGEIADEFVIDKSKTL